VAEGSPATTAKERLTQFLKDGKDWERKATNITQLAKSIDEVNPDVKISSAKGGSSEIFEI
jgi:hypothetical protein